jgi:hypothetical protein
LRLLLVPLQFAACVSVLVGVLPAPASSSANLQRVCVCVKWHMTQEGLTTPCTYCLMKLFSSEKHVTHRSHVGSSGKGELPFRLFNSDFPSGLQAQVRPSPSARQVCSRDAVLISDLLGRALL